MVSVRTLSAATVGAALVVLGTVGSAQAAILRFNTEDSRFTRGVDNQGAWSDTYLNRAPSDIYFVGRTIRGDVFRNFFTFDLSSLRKQLNAQSNDSVDVNSATLVLKRFQGSGNPIQTIRWFDVSTSARRLNRDVPSNPSVNDAIFRDLGTGDPYNKPVNISTTRLNPPLLRFALNSEAQADIEIAAENGEFFSIGGSLTLAPPSPTNPVGQSLFRKSSDLGVQQLVIDAETTVPEPSSVMGVLGFGAFGLGWMLKRRQKNQKKLVALKRF